MAYRKHGIRAIFVDYLQLMHSPSSESRQQEVAAISRGLKALAKDLNIPIVAMAQLNRNPEDKSRKGNRPRMSDLRESGAIEQDADVIMLLHREAYFKTGMAATEEQDGAPSVDPEENVAELIIAKQRNGPVGTIKLHFNKQYTRFDNHDPRQVDESAYATRDDATVPF
jgi:replicative DNA helicase